MSILDFACDREGRLVGVSPVVTLFGWNPEELQSVPALDLVHPADRALAAAALQTAVLQPGVPVALPTMRFPDQDDVSSLRGSSVPPDELRASVQSLAATIESRIGVGLLCREERARLLDGTVRTHFAPGRGTVVQATLSVSEGRR